MRAILTSLLFVLLFVLFSAMTPAAALAADFVPPEIKTEATQLEGARLTQKTAVFDSGDVFCISRYEFLSTSMLRKYSSSFEIQGDEIDVRFLTERDGIRTWAEFDGIPDYTAKSTVFISTDKESAIISVPAVYAKQESYETLEVMYELESPIELAKGDGFYTVTYSFPFDKSYIGEIWTLTSDSTLVEWDEYTESRLAVHELSGSRRFSLEGYYFETPSGYEPSGENVLFKHPACYTGGAFARSRLTNAETELGYVLMKLHGQSQNERGFFPTPCESSWLKNDFGIGSHYYDTRWNSDFGWNLLDAYTAYGDPEFLERAERYADFYIDFAENHSYETGGGILVSDYRNEGEYTQTHSSLNHHLSGCNFLLKLYGITGDGRFLALAEKMLQGIEETRDLWVMEDGNLHYALYYNGKSALKDYPYLTYNDLFTTRRMLSTVLGRTNSAVQYLMDRKLGWMEANGIEGYYK